MYRNLLLPVDLSEKSETAIATATQLIQSQTGTITLLHVVETIHGAESEEIRDFYEMIHEKAEKRLEQWAAPLAAKGFDVRITLRHGKRAPEIIRFAAEQGIDLVVVATHTVNPDDPTKDLGTLSHQLAMFCNCPVLLIR